MPSSSSSSSSPLVVSLSCRALSGLLGDLVPSATLLESLSRVPALPLDYQIAVSALPGSLPSTTSSSPSSNVHCSSSFPLSSSSSLDFSSRHELPLSEAALADLCRSPWKMEIQQLPLDAAQKQRWLEAFQTYLTGLQASAAPINSPKQRATSAEKKAQSKKTPSQGQSGAASGAAAQPSVPSVDFIAYLLSELFPSAPTISAASLAVDCSPFMLGATEFAWRLPIDCNSSYRLKLIQLVVAIHLEMEKIKNPAGVLTASGATGGTGANAAAAKDKKKADKINATDGSINHYEGDMERIQEFLTSQSLIPTSSVSSAAAAASASAATAAELDLFIRLSRSMTLENGSTPTVLTFPIVQLKSLPNKWNEEWERFHMNQNKANGGIKSIQEAVLNNVKGGKSSGSSSAASATAADKAKTAKKGNEPEAKDSELKAFRQWADAKYEIAIALRVPALNRRFAVRPTASALERRTVRSFASEFNEPPNEEFQEQTEENKTAETTQDAAANASALSVSANELLSPSAPQPPPSASRSGKRKKEEDGAKNKAAQAAASQAAVEQAAVQKLQAWKRSHRTVQFSLDSIHEFLSPTLIDCWQKAQMDDPCIKIELELWRQIRQSNGEIIIDSQSFHYGSVNLRSLLRPGIARINQEVTLEWRAASSSAGLTAPSTAAGTPDTSAPPSAPVSARPASDGSTRPTTPSGATTSKASKDKQGDKDAFSAASLGQIQDFFSQQEASLPSAASYTPAAVSPFTLTLCCSVLPSSIIPFVPSPLEFPWTVRPPRIPIPKPAKSAEEQLVHQLHRLLAQIAQHWNDRKHEFAKEKLHQRALEAEKRARSGKSNDEENGDASNTAEWLDRRMSDFLFDYWREYESSSDADQFTGAVAELIRDYHESSAAAKGISPPDLTTDSVATSSLFARLYDLYQFAIANPKSIEQLAAADRHALFEPHPRYRIAHLPESLSEHQSQLSACAELLFSTLFQESNDLTAIRARMAELSVEREITGDFPYAAEILQWRCWIEGPEPLQQSEKDEIALCWRQFGEFLIRQNAHQPALEAFHQGLKVSPRDRQLLLASAALEFDSALSGSRVDDRALAVTLFTLLHWDSLIDSDSNTNTNSNSFTPIERSLIDILNYHYFHDSTTGLQPVLLQFLDPEKHDLATQELEQRAHMVFGSEWNNQTTTNDESSTSASPGIVSQVESYLTSLRCVNVFKLVKSAVLNAKDRSSTVSIPLAASQGRERLFDAQFARWEGIFSEAEAALREYLSLPTGAALFDSSNRLAEECTSFFDESRLDGWLELADLQYAAFESSSSANLGSESEFIQSLAIRARAAYEFVRDWQVKEYQPPRLYWRLIHINRWLSSSLSQLDHHAHDAPTRPTIEYKNLCLEFLAAFPTALALLETGAALFALGDFDSAEAVFSRANALDRTNSSVWIYLALTNFHLGNIALASQIIEFAKKVSTRRTVESAPLDERRVIERFVHYQQSSILDAVPPALDLIDLHVPVFSKLPLWRILQLQLRKLGREEQARELEEYIA